MSYKYTNDITDTDLHRLEIFSVALDLPSMLIPAKVWMSESGNYTTAWNHNGDASGCFQAMPDILHGLGYRPDIDDNKLRSAAFRAETYSEQVRWAQKFYMPYKGKINSVATFYVATFLPADLDYANQGPDTVLVKKDGRRGWAFDANAGFDANHDLCITVAELEQAVDRACRGKRWEELYTRIMNQLQIKPSLPAPVPMYDLRTALGQQQALDKLGYKPGPIDGVPGPLTRAAVIAFQKRSGLAPDGIVGPNTRDALQNALAQVP